MKKIIALFLALMTLIFLFSCSGSESTTATNEGGGKGVDLSKLDGADLYAYSLAKKNKIDGAHVVVNEKTVKNEKEEKSVTEIYLKANSKTDYFFSQEKDGDGATFYNKKLYVYSDEMKFSTVMARSDFEEYFAENIGDKWYFATGFLDAERNGNEVIFRNIGDREALSLVSGIAADKITDVLGKGEFSDTGLLMKGEYLIKSDDEEFSATFEVAETGENNIRPKAPDMEFVEVTHAEAPGLFATAFETVSKLAKFGMVINSSDTVSGGGKEAELYYSDDINYLGEGSLAFKMISKTLVKGTGIAEKNVEKQTWFSVNEIKTREDDLTAKKKLSDPKKKKYDATEAEKLPREEILKYVPRFSDVVSLGFTETGDKLSFEFVLKPEKILEICKNDLTAIAERGIMFNNITSVTAENFSGVLTLYKSDMSFDSLSLSFEAKSTDGVAFKCNYSMLNDTSSEIAVEPITAPDYSDN